MTTTIIVTSNLIVFTILYQGSLTAYPGQPGNDYTAISHILTEINEKSQGQNAKTPPGNPGRGFGVEVGRRSGEMAYFSGGNGST